LGLPTYLQYISNAFWTNRAIMKEFSVVKVEVFTLLVSLRQSSVHFNVVFTFDLISFLVYTLF